LLLRNDSARTEVAKGRNATAMSTRVFRSNTTRSAARMWSNMTWWFTHTCPMNRKVTAYARYEGQSAARSWSRFV
jgi:hypothetical protein